MVWLSVITRNITCGLLDEKSVWDLLHFVYVVYDLANSMPLKWKDKRLQKNKTKKQNKTGKNQKENKHKQTTKQSFLTLKGHICYTINAVSSLYLRISQLSPVKVNGHSQR